MELKTQWTCIGRLNSTENGNSELEDKSEKSIQNTAQRNGEIKHSKGEEKSRWPKLV